MAGRENEDNSIELINTENQIETNIPQYMLNINPAAINHSVKNQAEADHDRASLNALKVAFNSLQGYHNEQAKKLFSLQKKYSRLQEYVQSTQGSVDLRFLEESYPQDQPSMAQAAGAYNESHNQDFGNTLLKRELMKNAINNQELHAKNQRINELEKDYKYILLEKERLHGDVEALSIVLSEKKNEIAARDRDLKQLNQKITLLQAELELKQSLEQENEHLRQRIELYEHSGAFNERDQEKEELRMRLNNVQEECRRLVGVYEEQNKNLDAKDKEITRLQSQCKQFEIENSIFRSQRNEGNDFTDSGTNAELEKALELVKKQSGEIRVLKQSAEQQQNVIQQLLDNVKQNGMPKAGELRGSRIAEGESCHYIGDEFEHSNRFGVALGTDRGPVRRENVVSPFVSNSPKYTYSENVSPRETKAQILATKPVAVSSPQIRETIVPTGNLNIRPMIANENRQPRIPAINVADSSNVSPISNVYVDTNIKPSRLRASDSDLFRLSEHENVHRNNSSSLSPPGLLTRNEDERAFVNHGAKPKAVDKLGFPARMTQSEVIYGNVSPKKDMRHEDSSKLPGRSRSAFFPLPDLSFQLENRPVRIPEENSTSHGQISHYDNEPDYENVFQNDNTVKKHTSEARDSNKIIYENFVDNRIQDHKKDNRTSIVPNSHGNFGFPRTTGTNVDCENDVDSLKICPSCSREFSRLSMEQFQTHVYECFDSNDDQPGTLQAGQVNVSQDEDRTCPMCAETFPLAVPQETYEAHVLAHFGDVPAERFEIIGS